MNITTLIGAAFTGLGLGQLLDKLGYSASILNYLFGG